MILISTILSVVSVLPSSAQADLNERQPPWKTTSLEDDLNERQPHWKKSLMEDKLNGRQP